MFGSSTSLAERGYIPVHVLLGTIQEAGMGMYRSGQPGSSRPSPTTSPPKTPALSNRRVRLSS